MNEEIKKVFKKIYIPFVGAFIIILIMIAVMLVEGPNMPEAEPESVSTGTDFLPSTDSEPSDPAQSQSPNDPPVPDGNSSKMAKQLYDEYKASFADIIMTEPNVTCTLSENTAKSFLTAVPTQIYIHEYTDSVPVQYISSSFKSFKNVKSIQLPDSVIAILSQETSPLRSKGAFYGNSTLECFISSENLLYIGNKAFGGCTALEKTFLPIKLRHIGDRAFENCKSLGSVSVFGNTSIGEGAFAGCSELENVYLSENVTRVGIGAFEHTPYYESLTDEFCINGGVLLKYNGNGGKVEIPDGVRVIADGVFSGYLDITEVVLPKSLEYIGNSAFRSCAKLESIVYDTAFAPIVGENAFAGCGENAEISVSELACDKRDMLVTESDFSLLAPQ